jgi:hypothetical protein
VLIVAEAAAALVASLTLTRDPSAFSLDGMDQARFCSDVQRYRDDNAASDALTVDRAVERFERQARAYRDLAPAAPTDVRPDLESLASSTDRLAAAARELVDRQRADPSFAVAAELGRRQAELAAGVAGPARRVEAAVRRACGIDVAAELPGPAAATTATTVAAPPR